MAPPDDPTHPACPSSGHIMVMTLAKSAKNGIPANATHGVQSDVASAGLFEKAAVCDNVIM